MEFPHLVFLAVEIPEGLPSPRAQENENQHDENDWIGEKVEKLLKSPLVPVFPPEEKVKEKDEKTNGEGGKGKKIGGMARNECGLTRNK